MKDTQLSSITEEFNSKTYRNHRKNGRWISAFSFKPSTNRTVQHEHVILHDLYPSHKESLPGVDEYESLEEDSGRERIKGHQKEAAGKVKIPEKWGQEELMKDWIDHSSFDASLAPKGILSARAALAAEGRRARSTAIQGFRIESMC